MGILVEASSVEQGLVEEGSYYIGDVEMGKGAVSRSSV